MLGDYSLGDCEARKEPLQNLNRESTYFSRSAAELPSSASSLVALPFDGTAFLLVMGTDAAVVFLAYFAGNGGILRSLRVDGEMVLPEGDIWFRVVVGRALFTSAAELKLSFGESSLFRRGAVLGVHFVGDGDV
jgi:hypothetical protein